jgi:hypothetical protein
MSKRMAERVRDMKSIGLFCAGWLLVSAAIAAASLEDGLVAYYPFDGDAQDASGHGRHGIVHGATLSKDHRNMDNSAYEFDGVDDYISFGNVLPDTLEMTVSMWIRCDRGGSGTSIFVDADGTPGNDVIFGVDASDQIVLVSNKSSGGLDVRMAVGLPFTGRWRHVVWILADVWTAVYVDGVESLVLEKGGSNQGYHNLLLGTQERPPGHVGDGGFWKGAISSLKVYDRALSDEEVRSLHEQDSSSGAAGTLRDGLIAYYPFDGDAKDQSGGNLHGNMVGPAPARDQHYEIGKALEFDGVDDYIYVGSSFPDAEQMSIAFWMYDETPASDNIWADPAILCDGDSAAGQDLEIAINKKGGIYLRADKADKNLNHTFSSDLPFDRTWRHVVWLIASTYSDLYVDGRLVMRIDAGGSNMGHHGLCIGTIISMGNQPGWSGYWKGRLSSLRIYARLLSTKEIQQLYEQERCIENDYRATVAIPDTNGNQAPELLVLNQDPVSHCPTVLVEDSLTAETLRTIRFTDPNTARPPVPTQGLVAYFPFDGDALSERWQTYKGTVKGATLTEDQNGKADGAYSLDGIDDCIYFGPVLPDMTAMSIAMWVCVDPGSSGTLFCEGDWRGGNDVVFSVREGNIRVTATKGGSKLDQTLPVDVTTNRWLHAAWTLSGTGSTVYIDGRKVATTSTGGRNTGYHDFIIGTEEFPQGSLGWRGYWRGKISSLRIYNCVLTVDEIKATYLEEAPAVQYKGLGLVTLRDAKAAQISLAAALLHQETSGEYLVEVRDLLTGAHVNKLTFLTTDHDVIGFTAVPDVTNDGIDDLSVIGKNRVTGEVVHEIRDTLTGAVIRTIPFPR